MPPNSGNSASDSASGKIHDGKVSSQKPIPNSARRIHRNEMDLAKNLVNLIIKKTFLESVFLYFNVSIYDLGIYIIFYVLSFSITYLIFFLRYIKSIYVFKVIIFTYKIYNFTLFFFILRMIMYFNVKLNYLRV